MQTSSNVFIESKNYNIGWYIDLNIIQMLQRTRIYFILRVLILPDELKVIKTIFGFIFKTSVRHPSADDLIPVLIDLLDSCIKNSDVIFSQSTFKGISSQI